MSQSPDSSASRSSILDLDEGVIGEPGVAPIIIDWAKNDGMAISPAARREVRIQDRKPFLCAEHHAVQGRMPAKRPEIERRLTVAVAVEVEHLQTAESLDSGKRTKLIVIGLASGVDIEVSSISM